MQKQIGQRRIDFQSKRLQRSQLRPKRYHAVLFVQEDRFLTHAISHEANATGRDIDNRQTKHTVEFIYNLDADAIYFMEMNTRLQVEHPVTEEITGIDLVKEQIYVAEGRTLTFEQEDLKINGHSMEVRVYAENPRENFLPDTGTLQTYITPQGPGVRVDDGYEQGMEIPIYYDPMIAKLTTHGANREQARLRMLRAIEEYEISGVQTTLNFCDFALRHDAFVSGAFDTKFVDKYFKPEVLNSNDPEEEQLAIAITAHLLNQKNNGQSISNESGTLNKWRLRAKQ
mgnify:CR=1 FL=1